MQPSTETSPDVRTAAVNLLHGSRLLLAEDTLASRHLLTIVLRKAGAEVTAVDNGQAAVDCALEALGRQRPFHAILLDMAMPVLDGYQAAQRMRAGGFLGPIIALTAHVLPGEREKCLAAGCDEYLGKPVDRAQLVAILARHTAGESVPAEPLPPSDSKPAKSLLESLPEPQRAKLLKDFVDSLVERVESMEKAFGDQDLDGLIHVAHSIHGTAYLFSLPEIAAVAGQIEHDLRDGAAIEQVASSVSSLAQHCRAAAKQ
jgi:CheY-like chemotaxis protein/HPt (histidine-containing phosphotransfer) domain-containing protein